MVRVGQFCHDNKIKIKELDMEEIQDNDESTGREQQSVEEVNEDSDSSDVEEDLQYDNELGEVISKKNFTV